MIEQLRQGITGLGLPASPCLLERLECYIKEICLWNSVCKLIAKTDNIVTRHVMDSLAGVKIIREIEPGSIADVGSGAGFPGVPLALWLDNVRFVLIERSDRRAGFLRNVVRILSLDNVTVLEKPVEETSVGGPFDVITFRAWTALNITVTKTLFPLLSKNGVIAAYKGRRETVENEMSDIASRCRVQIHPLKVPGLDAERCLVMLWPIS